jgi:nucleoside-diphosphate-sugar epimerase
MTPADDRDDGLGGFGETLRSTETLVAAMQTVTPAARLIVLSSSAVYGSEDSTPLAEDAPLRPQTLYGVSKAAQELISLRARWAGQLDVVVARSFNLVGPGLPARMLLGDIARQLLASTGKPSDAEMVVEVGNLTPRRDYLDVRDLAEAIIGIATIDHPPAVLNVASGRCWSVAEVVDLLIELSGRPAVVRQAQARRRLVDVGVQIGDAALLTSLTGWQPRIELAQSLRDLLDDLACTDTKETE